MEPDRLNRAREKEHRCSEWAGNNCTKPLQHGEQEEQRGKLTLCHQLFMSRITTSEAWTWVTTQKRDWLAVCRVFPYLSWLMGCIHVLFCATCHLNNSTHSDFPMNPFIPIYFLNLGLTLHTVHYQWSCLVTICSLGFIDSFSNFSLLVITLLEAKISTQNHTFYLAVCI